MRRVDKNNMKESNGFYLCYC